MFGRGTRRKSAGQAMVEFALIAPVLLILVFVTIDLGRLIYAYAAISYAAREGARTVALEPEIYDDCLAFQRIEALGQGFSLTADPNSIVTNTDPNNPGSPGPSTPPQGQGYIYIWPAVATADPPDAAANCSSSSQRMVPSPVIKHVSVQIRYHFVPLTPLVAQLTSGFTLTAISVTEAEY